MLRADSPYVAALPASKRQLLAELASISLRRARSPRRSKVPVVIVGAGPAGAAAAIVLRRHGCPALLLDCHGAPREKVCGDGLIADSHEALQTLGVLEDVRNIGYSTRAGRIVSPSGFSTGIEADFTTLERHFLDGILLRKAIEHGAEFQVNRVRAVEPRRDGLVLLIDGVESEIRTDYLIVASGATTRPWFAPHRRTTPDAVAARCYISCPVHFADMLMCFSPSVPNGYGWLFPLGANLYNVGVVRFRTPRARPRELNEIFRSFVTQAPVVSDLWKESAPLTPLKGAPLRCGLDLDAATPEASTMAVGEAIATTFPFTGEGIGKALQSGILAAKVAIRALESGDSMDVAGYRRLLDAELSRSYKGYALAEKWLGKPWMYDLLVRRIRKSAHLRGIAAGILTGSNAMDHLFSTANIVRSLWK